MALSRPQVISSCSCKSLKSWIEFKLSSRTMILLSRTFCHSINFRNQECAQVKCVRHRVNWVQRTFTCDESKLNLWKYMFVSMWETSCEASLKVLCFQNMRNPKHPETSRTISWNTGHQGWRTSGGPNSWSGIAVLRHLAGGWQRMHQKAWSACPSWGCGRSRKDSALGLIRVWNKHGWWHILSGRPEPKPSCWDWPSSS